jgi:hypothetical protein
MTEPAAVNRPWAGGHNPLGLTELEVASGVVLGSVEPPEWPETAGDPLEALFDQARRILAAGRCVVAFSGGRDSSALLAAFLHVARRDGYEEPLAITARWPGDESSDESVWQEHVARELDVRRWEIITPGEDFDLLGPLATELLDRHGMLWPAPVAALAPMIAAAEDGVLVTGQGGDEVFGGWRLGPVWAAARQGRGIRRSVRPLGAAALPRSVHHRRALAHAEPYQSWLTPEAHQAHRAALAAETVEVDRLWWPDYLRGVTAVRGLALASRTQGALCAARGGSFAAPLLAPSFLAALARKGGRWGFADRASAMRAVFAPIVGPEVLGRSTKATFGAVFWGPASRAFAQGWDGEGLDRRWVDPDALRAAWLEPLPVYGAALPLQAAWLASHPSPVATPGGFLSL